MKNEYRFDKPPAIVVGTCGHGLSLIRALHEGRVPVVALESNISLPGASSKLAHVEHAIDINGHELIDVLLNLVQRIHCPSKPVLFLTNDNMVRTVATNWGALSPYYLLSWSHCRDEIAALLDKSNLESHCHKQGLRYPESYLLSSISDIDDAMAIIGNSAIIKPSKPLSGFKTALPQQRADYERMIRQYEADLPFLVQKYIPGNDDLIHFCALYLDHGRVVARFDGRKLRSRPMGHTTIAESCIREDVYYEAMRFFQDLEFSGPVSVEFKRDDKDRLWVIEPTIGRTDFWVGLCTANNVNLPLVEYINQTLGLNSPQAQQDVAVWFNEERDPFGRLWLAFQKEKGLKGRRSSYIFVHNNDLAPNILSAKRLLTRLNTALTNHIRNILRLPLQGQ